MKQARDQSKRKINKKITIIQAGMSQADNPAKFAGDKLAEVFGELGLRVDTVSLPVEDFADLLAGLAESDGLVIALSLDWYGIGHTLQEFLDQCYRHKKSGIFEDLPLLSLVFSRQGFEAEAATYLSRSWQVIGGSVGTEVTGLFPNISSLAGNYGAIEVIEKKAEQFFRYSLYQKYQLPQSLRCQGTINSPSQDWDQDPISSSLDLQKQKEAENIQALSSKLKAKLEEKTRTGRLSLADLFMDKYEGQADRECQVQVLVKDKPAADTRLLIKHTGLSAETGKGEGADLTLLASEEVFRQILAGAMSFQKAFMTGQVTAKGELTVLYQLDQFFNQ